MLTKFIVASVAKRDLHSDRAGRQRSSRVAPRRCDRRRDIPDAKQYLWVRLDERPKERAPLFFLHRSRVNLPQGDHRRGSSRAMVEQHTMRGEDDVTVLIVGIRMPLSTGTAATASSSAQKRVMMVMGVVMVVLVAKRVQPDPAMLRGLGLALEKGGRGNDCPAVRRRGDSASHRITFSCRGI